MTTILRRAFIGIRPLVLAGVLLKHPNDEAETIYEGVHPVVDNWMLVTQAALVLGSLGWIVAMVGAAIAARSAGGRSPAIARRTPRLRFPRLD